MASIPSFLILPVPPDVGETAEIAASGREGETRDKTHVLRAVPIRDRRSSGILERNCFPKEKNQKERNDDLWKMTLPMEIAKTRILIAAWESLAKSVRLSHIYTQAQR